MPVDTPLSTPDPLPGDPWVDRVDERIDAHMLRMGQFSFNKPIILDKDGAYGTANRVYIPQVLFLKSAHGTVNETTWGTESAVPGYVAVAVHATAITHVYLDPDDDATPYKAAASGDAYQGDEFPVVITVYGEGWRSPHRVESTRGRAGRPLFLHPLVREGTSVRVAAFIYEHPNLGTRTFTPPNGYVFENFAWSDELADGAMQAYFDYPAHVAGTPPYVKTANTSSNPRVGGGWEHEELFLTYKGNWHSRFAVAENKRNENAYSLISDDVSSEWPVAATAEKTAITHADLLAEGHTQGYKDDTTDQPFHGGYIANPGIDGWVFVSVMVEAPSANAFGTPTVFLRSTDNVFVELFTLSLDWKAADNLAARYIGWHQIEKANDIGIVVVGPGSATADIIYTGIQYCSGPNREMYVLRNDFPSYLDSPAAFDRKSRAFIGNPAAERDIIYPEDMFLIEDRPMNLYPMGLSETPINGLETVTTFGTHKGADRLPYVIQGHGSNPIEINPLRVGATAQIALSAVKDSAGKYVRRDLTLHIGDIADVNAKTPTVLCTGDSLVENAGLVPGVYDRLDEHGASSITMLGTITCGQSQAEDSGLTPRNGEGRGGIQAGDYTNAVDTNLLPIATGGEAAYLALTSSQREAYNPFIREEESGDDPAHVKNGYIFDIDFYLTRFSFADPDFIIVCLGRNDLNAQTEEDAITNVTEAIEIMQASIRANLPNCELGFVFPVLARSSGTTGIAGDDAWPAQARLIKACIDTIADLADSKTVLIPSYAHMNQRLGWGSSAVATDPLTGVLDRTISDGVHPRLYATDEMMEPVFAWIVNRIT